MTVKRGGKQPWKAGRLSAGIRSRIASVRGPSTTKAVSPRALDARGERWLLRETGVTPDGNRTGAENTFTKVGDDRFTWESNNRTLNGDPQPGIARIEINRVKGN